MTNMDSARFDRNLASSFNQTTLSLELFAEFNRYRPEREAPVDAFLG